MLILANYFTDLRNTMKEKPDHKAMNMPSPEPKWGWGLQTIFTIMITLTVVILVRYWIGFGVKRPWFMEWWGNYGTAIVWTFIIVWLFKLALHGYWTWKKHNDWCKRVNS